ncbi:MAG TPA: zf-HC2 domain-containing protein [Bacteroidota bacterium]|nr:zf-HC2 domain-containing protein [Bacteroidota bacterium]
MQNEHWTLDEELLAEYVLGRLSDSQREACSRHLASCAECRKRLEDEQLLVAGVQRAGRADLKARLRQQLGLGEHRGQEVVLGKVAEEAMAAPYSRSASRQDADGSRVPVAPARRGRGWIYAAATAACVVIITGVGILNRWWSRDALETVSSEQKIAVATPPAAQADESSREPSVVHKKEGVVAYREEGADGSRNTLPSSTRKHESMPAAEADLSKKRAERQDVLEQEEPPVADEARTRTEVRATAEKDIDADARAMIEERLRQKDVPPPPPMVGVAFADKGTWIEGETAYIRMNTGANTAKNETDNVLRAATEQAGGAQAMRRLNATIEQRPLAEAPALRQQQRRQQAQAVLTNIRQTDSTLRLTLYPDSQLSERDLRQAQVYQVAADTIIVVLPGQMIRYHVESQVAVPVK